jgi:hypothetical protein
LTLNGSRPHPWTLAVDELEARVLRRLPHCRHLTVESFASSLCGVEMLLVYCVVLLAVLAANVTVILLAATIARRRMHHD